MFYIRFKKNVMENMSESLISSFLVSDVSESLRSLTKNEQCERIAQVAHQKCRCRKCEHCILCIHCMNMILPYTTTVLEVTMGLFYQQLKLTYLGNTTPITIYTHYTVSCTGKRCNFSYTYNKNIMSRSLVSIILQNRV